MIPLIYKVVHDRNCFTDGLHWTFTARLIRFRCANSPLDASSGMWWRVRNAVPRGGGCLHVILRLLHPASPHTSAFTCQNRRLPWQVIMHGWWDEATWPDITDHSELTSGRIRKAMRGDPDARQAGEIASLGRVCSWKLIPMSLLLDKQRLECWR